MFSFNSAPPNQAPPQPYDISPLDPLNNWPAAKLEEIFREDADDALYTLHDQIDWWGVVANLVKFVGGFVALPPLTLLLVGTMLVVAFATPFVVVFGMVTLLVVVTGVVLSLLFVGAFVCVPVILGTYVFGVLPVMALEWLCANL
ncbi:hypothetical protein ATEIFO6365_0012029200 [Aspergillus terreus]|uniref:Uncharacterized protein n=1 Tax=Aspergillus terreus TaxID=33178 RepID=A0A5M3ZB63_ASPTE|nr:hypothetical protein ATETN484_0013030200 [Aspergillus terreus]GFF20536.1 hypothetical protein ATEIFO6365_0012029200 [Aspergillus terreus]